MSNESLDASLVIKNALLASSLSKRAGTRLSMHGISFTEYLVMDYLASSDFKAVARIELAESMGMSASGITRLIAPMEKNHLIEKVVNPRDARQSLVKLSDTGERLYGEAKVSFEQIAKEMVGGLSKAQKEKMLELCSKVF
ncbi:MarR family transcriptional regulator [Thiomicrorhabdus sp. ZW0627]|uniref:MarR family winged helix-turn-helix transcriptional regulator n=1 Tax=Thiomicrorhabdus sp. ZW0627 TaxID=3039774 RepID=UPI0024362F94|nr:MarR family transcriptional regulator [Thiomicrorhabdus sp. ZW0627]MDG6772863.1 MarR family transcriptional regulator [Thiomicrorhabdus sp. ZW0627]